MHFQYHSFVLNHNDSGRIFLPPPKPLGAPQFIQLYKSMIDPLKQTKQPR